MKKNISYLFICYTALNLYGQDTYYRNSDGKIFKESKIKEQQQKLYEKFSKKHKDVVVDIEINDTQVINDSIIHDFGFHINLTGKNSEKSKLKSLQGKPLPQTLLTALNGDSYDSRRLKGKPTVLNFWFTKCKPCVDEMSALNKLKEEYKDQVNFVAITYESQEAVIKFLTKRNFEFDQFVNAQNYIDRLGITAYPKNIVLDEFGNVYKIKSGIPYIKNEKGKLEMGEATELKNTIEKLLKP